MEENQLPARPEQPAADHFLEDLAAATGLFTLEQIWREEELLDDMEKKEVVPPSKPAKPD